MDYKPSSVVKVLINDQHRDLGVYPDSRARFNQEKLKHTDGSGGDVKSTKERGYFLFENLPRLSSSI